MLSPSKRGENEMRTTIELSDDHRSMLHFLAARRGLRGYSKLIEEAIDFYIKEKTEKKDGFKRLLKMKGSWSREEAKRIKKKLRDIR
jgi:predicted transcriptional regulator